MSILLCPVCKDKLIKDGKSYKCPNGHSFDISKEGYVNLLTGSKSGDKTGDSKESARARHAFLAKGYYSCLKEYISQKLTGTVLDICCGEGYYDSYGGEFYSFDISKEMVRLASKSHREDNYNYFVANLSSIPVGDGSVDTAIHLFAPFNDKEFARVLNKNGRLYSVVPGKNHLIELKNIVYDSPYKNDEEPPKVELLTLCSKTKITDTVQIGRDDLKELFSMTPYFYRTSQRDKDKLDSVDSIKLTVDFAVFEYTKEK
ncbi:MAG: methyltransferase domain-containing protein [Eubacteriales bacterium]|nr:methyltransferase domain-containing protein [Eubacteriales bacterium]